MLLLQTTTWASAPTALDLCCPSKLYHAASPKLEYLQIGRVGAAGPLVLRHETVVCAPRSGCAGV